MTILKKLIFAPFSLIVFGFLIYRLNPLFASYDVIFSLSFNTLIEFIILASLILLTSLLFTLFATIAQDFKIVALVTLMAILMPLALTISPLSVILMVGTLISLLLSYFTLGNNLKTYLTFEPGPILGPAIRHLSTFLVLVISLSFFLSVNKTIQEDGFEIPDSLIDTAIKIAAPSETTTQEAQAPKFSINQLEQYEIDPKVLDSLSRDQILLQNLIKQTLKDQIQNVLKPYLGIIPAVLAILLFFTLLSFVSILNLFIYPLLWIIFYILERSGYIKFTTEQRTVKKMVV